MIHDFMNSMTCFYLIHFFFNAHSPLLTAVLEPFDQTFQIQVQKVKDLATVLL